MVNICTNIIHITYYGNIDENIKKSTEIKEFLESHYNLLWFDTDDTYDTYTEIAFESISVAPLTILSELSKENGVDIIGIAYEFTDRYVESFEYLTDLHEEETGGFIKLEEDESGEVSVLDEEFEALDDASINITDNELENF